MIDLKKYLNTLKTVSKKQLEKEFNVNYLEFDDFELINAYLIFQSIRDKNNKKSTLIFIPDKDIKSKFYIPTIITASIYTFIDNYIDNATKFEIGDIIQKDGVRKKITAIRQNTYQAEWETKQKGIITKTTGEISNQSIKKYICTTANISNQKVKTKFDFYKQFFSNLLPNEDIENEIPSKFKHKTLIITDKSIIDELKKYKIQEQEIHKAFPFRYITKSGTFTENLPIDPMIFIVNDYETARNFVLTKYSQIKTAIFIGQNKFKDSFLQISEDINEKKIENCLLIGSSDMEKNAIPNLIKWKWTLSELNFLNYFETYDIEIQTITDKNLTNLIIDFDTTLTNLRNEFGVNLSDLYKYVQKLFPITLPNANSRLINQIDSILAIFEKEGFEIISIAFEEIDEYDYENYWDEVKNKFHTIIQHKKQSFLKFETLSKQNRIDYLVVPKDDIEIWKEENKLSSIKNIISYNDYKELNTKSKIIVFLGFYGLNHFKSIIYNKNKIILILSEEEKSYYTNAQNRFIRETYNELKSPERQQISEIPFIETETEEEISDIMKRLFEKQEKNETEINTSFEEKTSLFYELAFEDDKEILILDENKTVLLKIGSKEREEKVKHLRIGDFIRVYGNTSKQELYKLALQYDTDGVMTEIENYSKLWKEELIKYATKNSKIETTLKELQNNGLSINNELTLRNWLNINGSVKFPQRLKDLFAIKRTIDSQRLNDEIENIKKYRRVYNGIMIAIGRNLSDEISEYIKSNKKGKLLNNFSSEQIQQFVKQNAKLRKIKSIKIITDEQE